jgi:ATP-binding protein involved in chromosome partitioning
MAYFTPAELPDNKYYIFGKGGARKMAEQFEVPFLGEVPIVQSIQEGGDRGMPAMMGDDAVSQGAFLSIAERVAQQVSIRNANLAPTKVVQVGN